MERSNQYVMSLGLQTHMIEHGQPMAFIEEEARVGQHKEPEVGNTSQVDAFKKGVVQAIKEELRM